MKLMLCWSGARSKAMAEALHRWLGTVIQSLEPWVSEHDIAPGARWLEQLNKELETTDFGILCLTPQALNGKWILFEAGALAKKVDTGLVVPYCLGLRPSEITGPLAQFQGVQADKSDTFRVLESINRICKPELSAERLRDIAEKFWPDLEKQFANLPEESGVVPPPRTEKDMLVEILQSSPRPGPRPGEPWHEPGVASRRDAPGDDLERAVEPER